MKIENNEKINEKRKEVKIRNNIQEKKGKLYVMKCEK